MSTVSIDGGKREQSRTAVDTIHDQMDANPHYPFNVQSGWLPHPGHPGVVEFLKTIVEAEPTPWSPAVQALDELLTDDPALTYLINDACEANATIRATHLKAAEQVRLPTILSKDNLLNHFNTLLTRAPHFTSDDQLVGLPFSQLVVGIDPTLSGMALFRLPMFNEKMGAILNEWHEYLGSSKSNGIFAKEGKQWLSPQAKKSYQFEIWQKDNPEPPYWNSWNSFFTRQFKDPKESRPIAAPDNNQIVLSANDGSLFRWDDNLAPQDVYWFKDMKYSLKNIFTTDNEADQETIDQYGLLDLFTDGSIFQTYLNPYNYHRWWCPMNGTVLFDPITIAGAYFNKLDIPDFAGATTASLPYLVQINARGLIVFETEEHGYVCCIPLGMSEVSTITFQTEEADGPAMKKGAEVRKGDEMGRFQYGGSSYAMIFQKLPGKKLFFQDSAGTVYQKHPVLPKGSASTGGNFTLIGSQIGKWEDVDFTVDSELSWQSSGYVNRGKQYEIGYVGGLWTANPALNDGNLYGPDGSSVIATQEGYPLQGQPEGALIARVGNNPPFFVGSGPTKTPEGQTGLLELCINDDLKGLYGQGLKDNEGSITVSIKPVAR